MEDIREEPDLKNTFINNNKLKVLIVDDDIKTTSALTSFLKLKYDVYCTKYFLKALKLITQYKIALIISEQAIPNAEMTGVEFMDKVKKLSPVTSRILLTNPIDFAHAKSALQPGDVFRLFKKPYNSLRLLEVIEEAIMGYLEKSGSLAIATERIHKHAPNINKEIKITPSISASANPVIIQCKDETLFAKIKTKYEGVAYFIHAKDKEATINILENTIIKAIIYCFQSTHLLEASETVFISQIKQELPHLSIIAILNKEGTNYQHIMSLIKQDIIYSYLPSSFNTEKICQQLSTAIALANKLYTSPIFLKWPPAEKVDISEEKTLPEKLTDVSSKITDKFKSVILSIKNLLNKENNRKN